MLSKFSNFLNSKVFIVFTVTLMLVILFSQADHYYGYTSKKEKEYTNIVSDGTGYYAYLPQYIVFPDSSHFSFTDDIHAKYPDKKYFSMISTDTVKNQLYSKFYVGTPFLQTPFYFVAHKLHQWNDWKGDGYQLGYRFSIQLAALFYWLIGVVALFQLFGRLGFNRFSILVGIFIITFGTNLNLYTSYYVSMSHVYSFSMIACLLNVGQRWSIEKKSKDLLWMFLVIGLIFIIRPINVLVILLIPFFFQSFNHFWLTVKQTLIEKKGIVLLSVFLMCIPLIVQFAVLYHQTSSFGINTYPNEGFTNKFTPQFLNVLFSYQKGFFVYAPAMIILFFALFYLFKKGTGYFLVGWSFTTLIWLYVICSWWYWDYGGGLGMRAMIEMLPLFMFPILYLFKFGNKLIVGFATFIFISGIYLYQIFQVQYIGEIIDSIKIEKKDFWNVFLKTDKRYRWTMIFDRQREILDEGNHEIEWTLSFTEDGWKVIQNKDSVNVYQTEHESKFIVNYQPNKSELNFKGKFIGKVKLNSTEYVPFFNIRYLTEEHQLVEESIFTIGSIVEHHDEFEYFEVDVNHLIKNKPITRIEFSYNKGGGNSVFENLVFEKYK